MTDERILVLMPTSKDGERTRHALAQAGLDGFVCKDVAELCREMACGAGAALLTEEAVAAGCLQEALRDQPPWSDFPLVVLAREGEGHAVRESLNVTLVERPVKIRSLLSVLRSALRSRRRQYEVRGHLETIRRERERYRVTLASIGDAVIATDAEGRVSFMNGVAEALTGRPGAVGRPLPEVFPIVNERTREPVENPALRALREGVVVGLANHTVLIAGDGAERPIDDSAAPIREGEEGPTGAVLVFRDVTERRRAEEARARLAAIVESSDDAIVSKSLDGVIRSWNAGAERIFGYTPQEAVGRPITLIIPPERQEEEPRILERLRRGERVDHFETVRLTKDGRRIDVSLTISPVLDSEGVVVGASKIARDITRRKRAEAERLQLERELRDIRSRMEAALEAGAIGTWAWDVPGDRFYGDPSLARIFAVPPEAVAGGPLAGLMGSIHPDDRQRVGELVARAVESGGRYEADYRVTDGDGGWRWVTARGQVELNGEGRAVRFPGVVIDVTEEKLAQEALARVRAESERRKRLYETALSTTPDLVYVFDLDHRFTYANEALLAMWGKTWDQAIGKTCLELGYPDWHASKHDEEIERVKATRRPVRGEVPFTGTNGTRVYDYIFVPVLGADGEVEAVAGTTRDITERQAMEQELREADRKKDDFIALLAHELRNPLAPIRNGLQVLRLAGGDGRAVALAREMMDRQMTHMVRLVDDLLDVSRINRGKMELRRARLALSDVVASAVETARPLIDEAGHELSVTLPGGTVYLDADLTRLAEVFANLLTNSAKYTPEGGRIWLSAVRRGGNVEVSVRDTGVGIPAASLPGIFDMFSQVDRGIERSTGGLGIGLALVKGLVEMHGGTVTVASEGEGKGSTFTVTLPVLPERPPPAAAHADAGQVPAGPSRQVLVVDDNRDGADSLALMLRLMGNEVRTAHDGVEAVAEAERFRPEVILMDIGMPRMNGLEATRRIREQPWGRAVKIIALTGWGQENDRERSREAGCDGHLVKPVELANLQQALAEVSAAGS